MSIVRFYWSWSESSGVFLLFESFDGVGVGGDGQRVTYHDVIEVYVGVQGGQHLVAAGEVGAGGLADAVDGVALLQCVVGDGVVLRGAVAEGAACGNPQGGVFKLPEKPRRVCTPQCAKKVMSFSPAACTSVKILIAE